MKRLYLGGNVRLGDEGAKALAIALARPGAAPLLECLELRCCGIGDDGGRGCFVIGGEEGGGPPEKRAR